MLAWTVIRLFELSAVVSCVRRSRMVVVVNRRGVMSLVGTVLLRIPVIS